MITVTSVNARHEGKHDTALYGSTTTVKNQLTCPHREAECRFLCVVDRQSFQNSDRPGRLLGNGVLSRQENICREQHLPDEVQVYTTRLVLHLTHGFHVARHFEKSGERKSRPATNRPPVVAFTACHEALTRQ